MPSSSGVSLRREAPSFLRELRRRIEMGGVSPLLFLCQAIQGNIDQAMKRLDSSRIEGEGRFCMAEDIRTQIGNFWKGLRKKATEAVESQEVGFVRGKVAARSVFDNAGNLIVDSGQTIDDGVIARAQEAGKLGALVSAAVTAQAQDVREKAKQIYESTPEGTEARSLATSEQYLEARRYIGWKAAMDVTDIRGTILVPAGKEIEDEDVRAVREAGQLGALIASAEQSGPPAA